MASSYFKNFPVVSYNNTLVTNVIVRAKIDSKIRDKSSVFFSYTVDEGERPDTIAAKYYEDPNFAWLIYYANEIIDPYFEWPLTTYEMNQYLVSKYGSVERAQSLIKFFKVNWQADESIISTAAYDALPAVLKKYWQPIIDFRGYISSYERSKLDTVLETNKVIEFAHSGDNIFSVDDIVYQSGSSAIVCGYRNGYVTVNKVQGSFTTGSLTDSSGNTLTTITAVATIDEPISATEAAYWTPVYADDYEQEINEQRKEIFIIDRRYLDQIELEMKSLLI